MDIKDVLPKRLRCVDWNDVAQRAFKTGAQAAIAHVVARGFDFPNAKTAALAGLAAAASAAWNTITKCRKGSDCCRNHTE